MSRRTKLLAFLVAILVGAASGAALFLFVGSLSWTVLHTWSQMGATFYFVVSLFGPPIVAVLVGWLTYREVRGRTAGPQPGGKAE